MCVKSAARTVCHVTHRNACSVLQAILFMANTVFLSVHYPWSITREAVSTSRTFLLHLSPSLSPSLNLNRKLHKSLLLPRLR